MKEDAFSKYHPAVNVLFFAGAICFGAFLQHPAYLGAEIFAGGSYYFLLNGWKGAKRILGLFPLFLLIAGINPLVNTRGNTVLFQVLGRPYTLEALVYGLVVATIFVVMLLWMGCYNKVLTGDKFTCLFSNLMPSVALVLVMVFRMIPNLMGKAKQLTGVRQSIGKGVEESAAFAKRLGSGITVLGVLTSWALEGGVVTGDSMRARGYGTTKRTSFMIYRMKGSDWVLMGVLLILMGITVTGFVGGSMSADYFPGLEITPVSRDSVAGFLAYWGYLMVPTVLQIKEEIQWNSSKYRI